MFTQKNSIATITGMFSTNNCSVANCQRFALKGSDRCLQHTPQNEEVFKSFIDSLKTNRRHSDMVLTDTKLKGVDFSNIQLSTCDFARCIFEDVNFKNAKMEACFFDFCIFENCNMDGCDARHSVFAGSKLIKANMTNTLLIYSNLMGLDARYCDFTSSDLYRSNFINSHLHNVQFIDCNMKGADFRFSHRSEVSFKYSNFEEAIFI